MVHPYVDDAGAESDSAMLPDPAMPSSDDGSPETTSPDHADDGMLLRDVQEKTAYYDYAAEKQVSQEEAKLFYQRIQHDAQKVGGGNWENPQSSSPQESPALVPRSDPNGLDGSAPIRRADSSNSIQHGRRTSQRFAD